MSIFATINAEIRFVIGDNKQIEDFTITALTAPPADSIELTPARFSHDAVIKAVRNVALCRLIELGLAKMPERPGWVDDYDPLERWVKRSDFERDVEDEHRSMEDYS